MQLTCEVCETKKDFDGEREAFLDGWDFPPSSPVTTCGTCPSAPLFIEKLQKTTETAT